MTLTLKTKLRSLSRETPPDLREELNRKRRNERNTPPVAPPKDKRKGKANPSDLRDSMNKRRQDLDTEMRSLRER